MPSTMKKTNTISYNNYALLYINEGNLFDDEGKFQDAKSHIEISYGVDSKNAETLDTYGVLYYHLEEYEKALEFFNKANEQDNISKIIWYHIGRAQTKLKKYKQALSSFDKSLDADPKFAAAHNGKAIVYYQLKKYNEAADEARKALAINPSLSVVEENLGKLASLAYNKVTESFWEFWTSSNFKKLISLAVGLAISIFIFLYTYSIYFGNDVTTVEIKGMNGTVTNSTTTTNQPSEIPETFFGVIALMLFIILLPEIRKAKLGPVEFELKEEDIHIIRNRPSLPESRDDLMT